MDDFEIDIGTLYVPGKKNKLKWEKLGKLLKRIGRIVAVCAAVAVVGGTIRLISDTIHNLPEPTLTQPTNEPVSIPEREYISVSCSEKELFSGAYSFYKLEQTVVNGRIYQFEPNMTVDDREKFITLQEQIYEILGETDAYIHRVRNIGGCWCDDAGKVAYYSTSSVGGFQQLVNSLKIKWGNDCNYGYLIAQAYDIHIIEEVYFEWISYEGLLDDPARMNLVYPCFMDTLNDEEQILEAVSFAIEIYSRMEDKSAGPEAFVAEIEEFAAQYQIDFTPTECLFEYRGDNCPLLIETEYMILGMDSTFDESAFEDPQYGWDWMESVDSLLTELEYYDAYIEDMKTRFDTQEEKLEVQLYGVEMNNPGYHRLSGDCFATSIKTAAYYYGYYLYYQSDPDFYANYYWPRVTLARYFYGDSWFEQLMYSAEHAVENEDTILITQQGIETYGELVEYYHQCLKNLTDEKITDLLDRAYLEPTASLADYLVRNYGEETFVALMIRPSEAQTLVGVDIATVLAQWMDWIHGL